MPLLCSLTLSVQGGPGVPERGFFNFLFLESSVPRGFLVLKLSTGLEASSTVVLARHLHFEQCDFRALFFLSEMRIMSMVECLT